jgi:glycosyltransferase involved in cell wall biosynthesis
MGITVFQCLHTLTYGDAISGEALAIRRVLAENGIGGAIYGLHAHPLLKGDLARWQNLEHDVAAETERGNSVCVLLHYSIGSPLNDVFARLTSAVRAIIHHNLTPPHWFQAYNERVTRDLIDGLRELPILARHADIVLADSDYNRQELFEMGFHDVGVLPLPLDLERWKVPSNSGIRGVLRAWDAPGKRGVNILHVGRLAPNKCIHDILKAFYFYHHKIEKKSRLWLIGSDVDTELDSFELKLLREEFLLSDAAFFVGVSPDTEVRAFYENCDAYLCMSEHEGFCVPLLEAMHFGLPTVAFSSTAIPETMGNAGILFDSKRPELVAELLNQVVIDSALREELCALGQARVQHFSLDAFRDRLVELIVAPLATRDTRLREANRGTAHGR